MGSEWRRTSLNLTMLGCFNELWFTISLCTCSSICNKRKEKKKKWNESAQRKKKKKKTPYERRIGGGYETFWPLSMNLTAKSSLVHLSLTSLATPKFPDPISFSISYLSITFPKFTLSKPNQFPNPNLLSLAVLLQSSVGSWLRHIYICQLKYQDVFRGNFLINFKYNSGICWRRAELISHLQVKSLFVFCNNPTDKKILLEAYSISNENILRKTNV